MPPPARPDLELNPTRVQALRVGGVGWRDEIPAPSPASACSLDDRLRRPAGADAPAPRAQAFTVVEATIPEMQAAMEQGRVTSRELVQQYLMRIALYEEHAARGDHRQPDGARRAPTRAIASARTGRVRGPLHGIPIALKDNIHTTDMPTTGGALAFDGLCAAVRSDAHEEPARRRRDHHREDRADRARQLGGGRADADAGQLQRGRRLRLQPVRSAARIRARRRSTAAPALSTGGSSSGVGTAANFWAGNVGTETSGSILSPSNQNMLVGIKPTVGRISRYGVIPITADQDTAGPMAQNVTDAAIMLGALESAAPDPNDPATRRCTPPPGRDYTKFLKRRRPEGRAHRHPARVLLRRRSRSTRAPQSPSASRELRTRWTGGGAAARRRADEG